MKHKKHLILAGAVLLLVSAVSLPAVAAGGPPEGKGNKKGDVGKSVEGFLYGDLYVIERDGNGEPFIYVDADLDDDVTEPCYDPETGIGCAQPLMEDCSYLPLMCQYCGDDPDCDWQTAWMDDEDLIACLNANGVTDPFGEVPPLPGEEPPEPWEPERCDLHPCFVDAVQEVHFGRMSVARTTEDVILKAYDEALSAINSAEGIGRDVAGRIVLDLPILDEYGELVYEYVDEDGDGECDLDADSNPVVVTTYEKTIDSPLENLALYREMMINGCLGGVEVSYIGEMGETFVEWHYLEPNAIDLLNSDPGVLKPLVCAYAESPDPESEWWENPVPDEILTRPDHGLAAAFVAGAADKTGHITLDMLINESTYLGINTVIQDDPGEAPEVTYHGFIESTDNGDGWYQYDQSQSHLPEESAYLLAPADCGDDCFCVEEVWPFGSEGERVDFDYSAVAVCRGGEVMPYLCRSDMDHGGVMTSFSMGENSVLPGCGGANWFTQAAEDAREIVWFLHNWKIPEVVTEACTLPLP